MGCFNRASLSIFQSRSRDGKPQNTGKLLSQPVTHDRVLEALEKNQLDMLSDQQLMVYIQFVKAAKVTDRGASAHSRDLLIDKLCTYLTGRLKKAQKSQVQPIYLHRVAELLHLTRKTDKSKPSVKQLSAVFSATVANIFEMDEQKMSQQFRQHVLHDLSSMSQIVAGIAPHQNQAEKVIQVTADLIEQQEGPIYFQHLWKILQKVSSDPNILGWTDSMQKVLIETFLNPQKIKLASIDVEMQVAVLQRFLVISNHTNYTDTECQELVCQLLGQIRISLPRLLGRPTQMWWQLFGVLNECWLSKSQNQISEATSGLFKEVHEIITSHALKEEPQKIDIRFLIELIYQLNLSRMGLDLQVLVELLRHKCAEAESQKVMIDEMSNTSLILKLIQSDSIDAPELTNILNLKWCRGETCNKHIAEHFKHVMQSVREEDFDQFVEDSLTRIQILYDSYTQQQQGSAAHPHVREYLELVSILEQLPVSEKQTSLLNSLVKVLLEFEAEGRKALSSDQQIHSMLQAIGEAYIQHDQEVGEEGQKICDIFIYRIKKLLLEEKSKSNQSSIHRELYKFLCGPLSFNKNSQSELSERLQSIILHFSADWKLSPQFYLNGIKSQYWKLKLDEGDVEATKYLVRAFPMLITLNANLGLEQYCSKMQNDALTFVLNVNKVDDGMSSLLANELLTVSKDLLDQLL